MSYKRKTWREKLADNKGFPKVMDAATSKRGGTGTFVIPAPVEVDELMRRVPKGKLITIDKLRETLALRHGATSACPMTTGIFSWIAAHAAEEATADGVKNTTPYWRTLKSKGELNPKYPGGIPGLKRKLAGESHKVVQKGKRFFVQDFEGRLAAL
jgi:6-O-methylguanine DNA methyltransferase, DNA binding domain